MDVIMNEQAYWAVADTNQFLIEDTNNWEALISDRLDSCGQNNSGSHQCGSILSKIACELHNKLNAFQKFQDAFMASNTSLPREHQPWRWYYLINTPLLQVGLITIYRFIPIPIHDHPGAYGVQRIISGKAHIRQYQHVSGIDPEQAIVSLKKVSDCKFAKDESATFTPLSGNLHKLESLTPRCILLSIMVHPYKPHDRSWYFPVALSSAGSERLYNRVRKRISPHERME